MLSDAYHTAPLDLDAATGFLRCGFSLGDLELWLSAPASVRELLVAAATRLEADRAATAALAMSGPEGLAAVMAPLDGGRELRLLALGNAARGALRHGRALA